MICKKRIDGGEINFEGNKDKKVFHEFTLHLY